MDPAPITHTFAAPAPAAGSRLGDLFASPLARHVAGVLLTLALGWLSLKLGVAPVPLPTLPAFQAAPVTQHFYGYAPPTPTITSVK